MSAVNCAVKSDRKDVEDAYDFKIGEKLKLRTGYKIRESKTAVESLYSYDMSQFSEFTLADTSSASNFSYAIGMLASALMLFAF